MMVSGLPTREGAPVRGGRSGDGAGTQREARAR